MSHLIENTSAPDATRLLVDLPAILKATFGVQNPPPMATVRSHAYGARFPYLRLPNGKLAVLEKDLPAIAAMYGSTGNVRAAA